MRLSSLVLTLAVLSSIALARPAAADHQPYPPGKISVWTPDDWKVEKQAGDGGAMLVALEPHEAAMVMFAVVDASGAKAAKDAMGKFLDRTVKGAKLGKPKAIKINGLSGSAASGKGKIDGEAVELRAVILSTPNGKILLGLAAIQASKAKALGPTLDKIRDGIRPLP